MLPGTQLSHEGGQVSHEMGLVPTPATAADFPASQLVQMAEDVEAWFSVAGCVFSPACCQWKFSLQRLLQLTYIFTACSLASSSALHLYL